MVGAGIGLPLGAWMTPDVLRLGIFVVGAGLLGGWVHRLGTGRGREREGRPGSGSPLRRSFVVLFLGSVFALGILWVRKPPPLSSASGSEPPAQSGSVPDASPPSASLPGSVRHRVRPPRYTGHDPWEGRGLGVRVPAHSDVAWRVEVPEPVERVTLETPEKGAVFHEEGADRWVVQRRIHRETEVRLRIVTKAGASHTGPWTRVEVIPDRPPTARFVEPPGPVVRDPAVPGSLAIEAVVGDDYGVSEARLAGVLTAPGGQGERQEHRWPLREFGDDSRGEGGVREVEGVVDLGRLAPSAGSRLLLRVEVVDNRVPRPQEGRSEARIVRFEPPESEAG